MHETKLVDSEAEYHISIDALSVSMIEDLQNTLNQKLCTAVAIPIDDPMVLAQAQQ